MSLMQRIKKMLDFSAQPTLADPIDAKKRIKSKGSGSIDTFIIKYHQSSITLAIALGGGLFILLMLLLKMGDIHLSKSSILDSYIWNIPRNTSLISALIAAIICIIFGKKNAEGAREFNKKHIILKPILYVLFFYVLLMFGVMLGIYISISTNIFF